MRTFYLPLLFTVGGGLLYHVGMKSVSTSANPFVALLVSAAALMAVYTICGLAVATSRPSLVLVRASGWSIVAVGVGAASIELGFLWAYHQGWQLSRASLATSVTLTLLLAAVGLMLFKERLTVWNVFGIGLCMAGLLLLTRGK